MSGAPCLAIRHNGYYSIDPTSHKATRHDRTIGWRLLGIYSGRVLAGDDLGAQLGLVWRENLLYETIDGATAGNAILRAAPARYPD
jgi:hypothetical protein